MDYSMLNGSAVAPTYYTASSGTSDWADGDGPSKTIYIPLSNPTLSSGGKSSYVALTNSPGDTPSSAIVNIKGGGATSGGAVFWVYHNGKFSWRGDYSWNATINYRDTSGGPLSGRYDISVKITGQWGGFQPYAFAAGGSPFDTTPYRYLQYCSKPTQPNQSHGTAFAANNDVADGFIPVVAGPDTTKYGPVPTVGKWGCYKIPLADFGMTHPLILKFSITDGTGNVPNQFYLDDVGFTSE